MAQQGPVADSCVHGNGPSSSIGGGGGIFLTSGALSTSEVGLCSMGMLLLLLSLRTSSQHNHSSRISR